MCSDPLQKADVLTLVSGNLVVWTKKKYTSSSLNEQKKSNRRNSSKQHKNLGITGPCSTSTFFRGKALFYWVRSDNAEDDDILLQNWLGEPFCCILHCSERTEFFRSKFLFHGQNIYYLYWAVNFPPPIGLELVVMDFALDKSYLRNNQSLSFTFLLPFTFLNGKSRWRLL